MTTATPVSRCLAAAAVALTVLLTACGGGDDPTTQAAPAAPTTPTATAPTISGDLRTASPVASYTMGSADRALYDETNRLRLAFGSGAIEQHPSLDHAATSHASYIATNLATPTTYPQLSHSETPGAPGFTGAEPAERAVAAGYPAAAYVAEVLATSQVRTLAGELQPFAADCMNGWLASNRHRQFLLDSGAGGLGVGQVLMQRGASQAMVCALITGYAAQRTAPAGWTGLYPMRDQAEVPQGGLNTTEADGGFSVSLALAFGAKLQVTSFKVRPIVNGVHGPALAGKILSADTDSTKYLSNWAFFEPATSLAVATVYEAAFVGREVRGGTTRDVAENWRFTTAPH